MNKPLVIARNDHEVYFIELLPRVRHSPRALASLAEKSLLERHPGFSRETVFDFSVVRTRGRRWLMVTAMERRELDVYRLAASFTRLATATSAIVRDRRFLDHPVSRYGDELIGYNADRDEPVSLPLTERDAEMPEGAINVAKAARNFRAAVFPRPSRETRSCALVCAALMVTLFAIAALVHACVGGVSAECASSLTNVELNAGPAGRGSGVLFLPGGCRVLADFSAALISVRGSLDSFSYDETGDRPVRAEVRGCEPLELGKALSRIAYLANPEYGRIEYDGSVPHFDVSLTAADGVRSPTLGRETAFPSNDVFLSIICGQTLRAAHIDRDGANGFSLGIGAGDMIASMQNVLSSIERFGARISTLSVRVLRSERAFDIACSIVMGHGTGIAPSDSEWKLVIDTAGFSAIGRKGASRIIGIEYASGGSEVSRADRIGRITGVDGETISFVKGADGKISIREE